MNVFIGGAWPYANGSLHIGHVAALLPGDILARYFRQKGVDVLYVSGSDCNGTPISIRANQENKSVKTIADKYHSEFTKIFSKLGFTYDLYTRTDSEHHHKSVQKIFLSLLDRGLIYKKRIEQAYCVTENQFLPDRYVEGICPNCGSNARGDQCDNCSSILDPLELQDKKCKLCGSTPEIRETEHFYFSFSKFQNDLEKYVANSEKEELWRDNAISLTKRYLSEGIPDRAVTRDLPNGIDVPVPGYESKKIYVWIEAVAGYYTASLEWAKQNEKNISKWWNSNTVSYYVHGKDNIPFHTIIWPSILLGLEIESLPKCIISNEYVTLEKRKISTSKNWAVWLTDLLNDYHPDSIRYFLTINAPENRDMDFSWREFIYSHNSELLGAYANFINRTLKFIEKSFNSKVPQVTIDKNIRLNIQKLYRDIGRLIENGQLKDALEMLFKNIRDANRYFDEQKPWIHVKENIHMAEHTLSVCVYIILNMAQLLNPFLPFSSSKVSEMLGVSLTKWEEIDHLPNKLNNIDPLFSRIDTKQIDIELEKLKSMSSGE